MTDSLKDAVKGAVARGWCSQANEDKEMDVDLASAIFSEVWTEVAAHLHVEALAQRQPAKPLDFFQNVDAWGAAEWFDRLAKAIHEQDAAVLAKNDLGFETYRNIAASSAMRLVRDYEQQVRAALAVRPAEGTPDTDNLCIARADIALLTNAMREACDLLMEVKQGSPARSPGHNARLRLERALSLLGRQSPAEKAGINEAMEAIARGEYTELPPLGDSRRSRVGKSKEVASVPAHIEEPINLRTAAEIEADRLARKASARSQPGSGWQPIETAPSACHVLACRFDDCEWIYAVVSSPPTKPFTHWKPLPTPPLTSTENNRSRP